MNYRYDKFNCDLLMNDLLTRNLKNYSYWLETMNNVYKDQFWIMLNKIMNDLLIAYLVKRYGKYDGSSKAYNLGLSWGRAKTIREFNIPYESEYILYLINELTNLDYNVKTGKMQQEDIFNYYVCLFM